MNGQCSKCGGDTDTGFTCVRCGHSMQPLIGGTQPTIDNTGSLKCPHWYRSTDGVHVVVVDRCNNPNCEQWALQASRPEAGA